MVVPTKTTVTLNIVSSDVVHSWWIPALGGKYQAVPGYHNYGWFKIEKPGVYRGQCANLCGRGHARMIAIVRAEEPAEFDIWLANQKRMLEEANAEAARTGQDQRPARPAGRTRPRTPRTAANTKHVENPRKPNTHRLRSRPDREKESKHRSWPPTPRPPPR